MRRAATTSLLLLYTGSCIVEAAGTAAPAIVAPVHANVARVADAARRLGLTVETRHFPEGTRTAADAAAAIDVDLGQIVKSLVFSVDEAPVLALVPGDRRLDEPALAAAAGGVTCRRPDAAFVRAATGFPIGGIPPLGHTTRLPAFVDDGFWRFDVVWAAAGTPHDVFALSPADLLRVTAGTRAPIGT